MTIPKKNKDAIGKVLAADLRGDAVSMKKPLYIEQNTYDICVDTPIFRIFQVEFLLADIRAKQLTHTRIGPMIWGDPAENPLLGKRYRDNATDEKISLEPLIRDLFGSCWSLTPINSPELWDYFSYGKLSVRIQTTPKKLLSGVMHTEDPFFMLHHFIGKVNYLPEDEFDAFYADGDYTKYLDSLGQNLALSAMRLPIDAESEQEVRLVYSFDSSQDWAQRNVIIIDNFAKVPFSWREVVDDIVSSADCPPNVVDLIRSALAEQNS